MHTRATGIAFALLAGTSLLFADSQPTRNLNQGGPAVEKRNYTEAEIEATLRSLGVPSSSGPISCDIEDSTGAVTTQVTASGFAGGPFYWLHYLANGASAAKVHMDVIPLFTGSPLVGQRQSFTPNSTTDIVTPFGVPFWGNNLTSGPWALVVYNNLNQHAVCRFTVVP